MTTIDLYSELIRYADHQDIQNTRSSGRNSIKSQADQFQNILREAKQLMEAIKDKNRDILSYKDKLAFNADPKSQNIIVAKIDTLNSENYQNIDKIRKLVEKANQIVKKAKEVSPNQPETLSKIYRKQHLTDQTDKILVQVTTIQKIVEKFSLDTSSKRIRFLLPQISDKQAFELAKKGNSLDQVLTKKVTGIASDRLKYQWKDVLEKTEGIKRLEKSCEENLKLIKQVSFLVQQQGQMINSIYDNVMQAKDYVQKAQVRLKEEKKQMKSSRKRICCIILVAMVILALIIVPIILKVVKNNSTTTT